ncbi:hypothetical protein BDY19DRAFT_973545 [Irpex rosettiformis]|uniref:Uncharacterized protein n=1 Tax=Irpex rosettiformis TaxID=378272 RepID=A0ACB8TQD4_9APHY|nr:hypothetical protein BDY19DRAFT_973545 [Irpex rosettiformis]
MLARASSKHMVNTLEILVVIAGKLYLRYSSIDYIVSSRHPGKSLTTNTGRFVGSVYHVHDLQSGDKGYTDRRRQVLAVFVCQQVIQVTSVWDSLYAEQLSTYGHGHPLWYPEPTKGLDGCVRDAQLGDVGYIDEDGSFRRLFNVTVGAEHELNAGGVPDGFVPLNFNEKLITVKEQFLAPGPLCSRSVKGRAAEATASTNVCGAGGGGLSYNFHCTSDRGALLLLKDYATKTSISSNPHFPEYMRRHHESWYRFATDPEKLGIECMPEDIILVRGTTKTSAWTVAAFLFKIDRVHGLAVEAQLGPAASFGLTLSSEHGIYPTCEQRSGPYGTDTGSSISPRSSQEPLKDHCEGGPFFHRWTSR